MFIDRPFTVVRDGKALGHYRSWREAAWTAGEYPGSEVVTDWREPKPLTVREAMEAVSRGLWEEAPLKDILDAPATVGNLLDTARLALYHAANYVGGEQQVDIVELYHATTDVADEANGTVKPS